MKKAISCIISVMIFSFWFTSAAGAEELSELKAELRALKDRVAELEEKITRQEELAFRQEKEVAAAEEYEHKDGVHEHIFHRCPECGFQVEKFKIGAAATFIGQAAFDPNNAAGDNEIADANYTADIEIEREIGDYGLGFIHLEVGDGGGLSGDEITSFSGVNAKAGDTNNRVDLTEAWYEHYLFDRRLTLTAGKLKSDGYMDQNTIADDDSTKFLSSTFKHSSSIEFPSSTYGLRAKAEPWEWLELESGIFDDNGDWEDVFEDLFSFAQVNFKPSLFNREGNYRVYFWHDDSKHTKWADSGTATEVNFGVGSSCNQKLNDVLTAFARFGWEDPDVSIVEWAWSAGFQLDGAPWKRNKDYLGCAIGMDIPSGDYGDAGYRDNPEGHIETYYNFHVNNNLAISPDYQLIWNPNGNDNDDPINILGVRSQLDF